MKYFISGRLNWVALWVGILVLASGISVFAWLLQRGDGLGPVLEAASSAATGATTGAGGGEVAGLPVSAALEATQGEATGSMLTAANGATVSDSAELDAGGAGQVLPAANVATGANVSDSARLVFQREEPPPRGDPGDAASFQDSVALVVRDAEGNIKQQETVR